MGKRLSASKASRVLRRGTTLGVVGIVLGFASLAMEYGFKTPPLNLGVLHALEGLAVGLLWSSQICQWVGSGRSAGLGRILWINATLVAALIAGWFIAPRFLADEDTAAAVVYWAVFGLYLFLLLLVRVGHFTVSAAAAGRAPARVLVATFAMLILTGAACLMLPAAHRDAGLTFTDAVFTATSAACVTGLVVEDTGGDFTRLGQTIIMLLIQTGGLGIMIFGSLFALLLSSRLSLRESMAMQDLMQEQSSARIARVAAFVCVFTFALEALGVVALYGVWQTSPERGGQFYNSLFHSISAFCNAGFSLQQDNLEGYRGSVRVYLVIAPLIVLGGLGFCVLENLFAVGTDRLGRLLVGRRWGCVPVRLTLHSKIVLVTTGSLLVAGAGALLVLDWTRPEGVGACSWGGVLDAWFWSVTARTAGFNTVPSTEPSAASKLVLILLMSVGGSPGSTAGGVKTVTLAVLMLLVYATVRRRQQVDAFGRQIPGLVVRRAATLLLIYGGLLWGLTVLLSITEQSTGHDLLSIAFEVASALGTVGLSLGLTEHLTTAGKWVIIAAMLVGRLGPLSLLTALTFNTRPVRYEYPREALVVG